MKSPWPSVCVVATIAVICTSQATPDELDKVPVPAADPMRGMEAGQVRDDNGLKTKLVWCPPGVVTMENVEPIQERVAEQDDEPNDDDDGDPKNNAVAPALRQTQRITTVKVFLTRGYWLGKYEVTQSEWKQVMKTEPWKGQNLTKAGADFPATFVDWNDATEFCRILTEQERHADRLPKYWEYTLPTEAQWERACRARTETVFSFGDDESKLDEYAWYGDNSVKVGEHYARRGGLKKGNPWGIHDMHGNIWEWCRDVYTAKLPGGRDPEAKTGGSDRVFRGGGWRSDAASCRSASRFGDPPGAREYCLGFRLALSSVR
jgi:formylglycine-generating enzyme required for sulfatase activity